MLERVTPLRRLIAGFAAAVVLCSPLQAQDSNIWLPVRVIERRIRDEPLPALSARDTRFIGDRTQQVSLEYPDSTVMLVKWARAPRGGSAFNNEPRYEIAAYEVQKLFLAESDFVVPPTAGRAVSRDWLRQFDPDTQVTFDGTTSVVLVVQYWLMLVGPDNFYDPQRFEADTVYARHFADFNLVTHLIRHSDVNVGNFLISSDPANPRVFSVDNGVAFRSEASDRGYAWRDLRVDKLPRATVERLRAVTEENLHRMLGVLLQFEIRNGELVAVEPTANLGDSRGVRTSGSTIQFGLTRPEIRDTYSRLRDVLGQVDSGRIKVF